MATLARMSVDTVKRDCKTHGFETRTDDAGRILVNVPDFLRIGRIRPEDLTTGASPAESAEMTRNREVVTALKTQVAEPSGRLSMADMTVDTLREQLAT